MGTTLGTSNRRGEDNDDCSGYDNGDINRNPDFNHNSNSNTDTSTNHNTLSYPDCKAYSSSKLSPPTTHLAPQW